jgi:hypothetical protein
MREFAVVEDVEQDKEADDIIKFIEKNEGI